MSTRAIVNLKDLGGNAISLYCYKDGYVRGGVGEWLHTFCANYKGKSGVPEVLYAILKSRDSWLDSKPYIDVPDYEYVIDCTNCLRLLMSCWKLSCCPDNSMRGDSRMRQLIDVELSCVFRRKQRGMVFPAVHSAGKSHLQFFRQVRDLPSNVMMGIVRGIH